jgi:hypothetical protein
VKTIPLTVDPKYSHKSWSALSFNYKIRFSNLKIISKKVGKRIIPFQDTPSGKKALTVAKRKFCKIFLGVFP